MIDDILLEAEEKMEKAVTVAKDDFTSIRTGRVTPAMFNKITAEYYGTPTPINQLASFQLPEPRMVIVQPYDASSLPAIEKAIRDSDLGLEPSNMGGVIRVPLPALNEQRRKELVKVLHKLAEEGRVHIRHSRTDTRDKIKKLTEGVSEDDKKHAEKDLQKLHDDYIAKIEAMLKGKEAEIMEV